MKSDCLSTFAPHWMTIKVVETMIFYTLLKFIYLIPTVLYQSNTFPTKSVDITCDLTFAGNLTHLQYLSFWPREYRVCEFAFKCQSICNCILEDRYLTIQCIGESISLKVLYTSTDFIGLSWSGSGLTGIGSKAFVNLKGHEESRLLLANNDISQLHPEAFKDLANLIWLDLSSNNITHLNGETFNGLFNLQWLLLFYNQILKLDQHIFKDLGNLQYLFLSGNKIVDIHPMCFQGPYNMSILILSENNIEILPSDIFRGLQRLTTLTLDNNKMTGQQPNLFTDLGDVFFLDLSYNNMPDIHPQYFKGLISLTDLYLSNGGIIHHSPQLYDELPSLLYLRLSENHILDLQMHQFNGSMFLSVLYLDYNDIRTIHPKSFDGHIYLRQIFLQNNDITTVPLQTFAGLYRLSYLYLNHNKIKQLESHQFEGLSNLRYLKLHKNSIKDVYPLCFEGLFLLEELHIYKNEIREVHLKQFKSLNYLTFLYLENNNIRTLHPTLFEPRNVLWILTLQNNNIETLHPHQFEELQLLLYLDLSNNKLHKVAPHIFYSNVQLVFLSLSNNTLSVFPQGIFQNLYNMEIIDLSQNLIDRFNASHMFNNSISKSKLMYFNLRKNTLYSVNTYSFQGFPSNENQTTEILVDNEATCCFIQNSSCNATTPRSQFLTCGRLLPNQIQRIAMWLLGIFAVISNAGVLFVRNWGKQETNKVQVILISNLSLSDFFMGIYMIIIISADVYYRNYFPSEKWRASVTCKIAGTISVLSSEASVFFVTLISIDRFMGIRYTFSDFRIYTKSARVLGLIVWVVALTLAIMSTVISEIDTDVYDVSEVCTGLPLSRGNVFEPIYISSDLGPGYFIRNAKIEVNISFAEIVDSRPGMYFGIAIFTVLNSISFLVVFICYFGIFITVMQTAKQAGRAPNQKEELKMAIKMGTIVITDLACWLPIIILSILVQSGRRIVTPDVYTWIVTFVLPINSAINPFLYTLAAVIYNHVQKSKQQSETNMANLDSVQRA